MITDLGTALQTIIEPQTLVIVLLAATFGLLVGAMPGLTATLGAALLVPFAFFLDPVPAVASIIAMSATAIFAGDVPGALLRIPGTPSSAAYVEDQYALTRKGKGSLALGVGLIASVIGGLFGSVVLILLAQVLGRFAINFSSFEYFWVAVLGLTAAVIISQGSQLKGAIALLTGLLVSTIGLDPTVADQRFTFGSSELMGGVGFIPAMIGLFGISEVLRNVVKSRSELPATPEIQTHHMFRDSARQIRKHKAKVAQGSAIGSAVGVLPGAGADIAAWISYAAAKATSKRRKEYGRGSTEAIAGAGSANNAGLGSAYVPTLAFGIPGDTITAILIGVLLVKGIEPGPELFTENAPTLYSLYLVFMLANILLIPLGFLLIKGSSYVLRIPRAVLMAMIVAVSIVGSYAINNSYLDVAVVLVFGILGVLFERYGIPLAPVVLGIVLGPIVERNFMSSVLITGCDFSEFFTRPISAVLVVLVLAMLTIPMFQSRLRRRREASAEGSGNAENVNDEEVKDAG